MDNYQNLTNDFILNSLIASNLNQCVFNYERDQRSSSPQSCNSDLLLWSSLQYIAASDSCDSYRAASDMLAYDYMYQGKLFLKYNN